MLRLNACSVVAADFLLLLGQVLQRDAAQVIPVSYTHLLKVSANIVNYSGAKGSVAKTGEGIMVLSGKNGICPSVRHVHGRANFRMASRREPRTALHIPVSYTHLSGGGCKRSLRITWAASRWRTCPSSRRKSAATTEQAFNRSTRPEPVSYTHLDVYKRQAYFIPHEAVGACYPFQRSFTCGA